MQKVTLQIPMNERLKVEAEKAALAQGFSSLQELVRVLLSKVAQRKIEVQFEEVVILSKKNEKRYLKMTEDFKNNRNVYTSKNVEEFLSKLNGN